MSHVSIFIPPSFTSSSRRDCSSLNRQPAQTKNPDESEKNSAIIEIEAQMNIYDRASKFALSASFASSIFLLICAKTPENNPFSKSICSSITIGWCLTTFICIARCLLLEREIRKIRYEKEKIKEKKGNLEPV